MVIADDQQLKHWTALREGDAVTLRSHIVGLKVLKMLTLFSMLVGINCATWNFSIFMQSLRCLCIVNASLSYLHIITQPVS